MAFCNISSKDRITRIGFGLLFIAALSLSWSTSSLYAIASIMIVEGLIGWCGMATVVDWWQQRS